eukprot:CAMPEP_0172300562 /NCGR_PEP_ID=MMETSP1058-20130122/2630_1 /TAXON_ID=83371 /ORGANISM="Detonula confervacea, Strain CCMP 353" /LENGTH=245 /DNA_ID=CAMNT_0013010381 /DNA_START=43 /DNA_END=780 /DNA_ORIENTATION=+
MSTSNQQQRGGGGRRQPFGFINANTLSSATGPSSAVSGNGGAGVGTATAAHSSDPVKNESKKKMRGILRSIVTRSKGKRNERSATTGSGSSDEDVVVSMLESPTKKTRVMTEEESKPSSADTATTTAAAVDVALPMPEKQECSKSDANEFAASDLASMFRQRQRPAMENTDFWNDGMEDMLELKQANPILDDSEEDEEGDNVERGRTDPSQALTRGLDESVSCGPIMWSNRLQEDKDGFKIHFDT